ncbi:MAG: DUF177 domain-containing protein [Gammaproteobacteria bacterium]|nr:DUF177 domain-containing protein [Gammaproteobacteria bacterium]
MVKLPVRFNPSRLLARDQTYAVEIPVAQFTRLSEFLLSEKGMVRAEMRFFEADGRVGVAGHFQAGCEMECQRCLNSFEQNLEADFSLTFVSDEAAAEALPDELDPVILDENGHIHSVDLLEDELILQLPVSARHTDIRTCVDLGYAGELTEDDDAVMGGEDQTRRNPFEILKNLTKTD